MSSANLILRQLSANLYVIGHWLIRNLTILVVLDPLRTSTVVDLSFTSVFHTILSAAANGVRIHCWFVGHYASVLPSVTARGGKDTA